MVAIITRKLTDDLASLVKQIDAKVSANKDKKMASFVVVLSEDPAANEAKLKELAKKARSCRTGSPLPFSTNPRSARKVVPNLASGTRTWSSAF